MANCFTYKEKSFRVGDTVAVNYTLKEGEKERAQLFKGVLLKVKGSTDNTRMITVRKISKIGIGVEKIIPLTSPNLISITRIKETSYRKAKAYFIRGLTESETKKRIYSTKSTSKKS